VVAGSSSDDLWCLGGHGRLRLCVDGAVLGFQASLRRPSSGLARFRIKDACLAKIVTYKSLAIGRFSPPDPGLVVVTPPWGDLTENWGPNARFFFCAARRATGGARRKQRTPPGGDLFFAPPAPNFPFKHPDVASKAHWLNLGTPTGRSGFWFALGVC
jgi:hypothetical protein